MGGALALTASLLAAAGPAAAPPATTTAIARSSCDTYTRASVNAPAMVRAWLSRSSDDHVRVCRAPAGATGEGTVPTYAGESTLRRQGGVCSYLSHRLAKVDVGSASRLERYERGEVQLMALADGECPAPYASSGDAYVPTYDVSARAFQAIMQLWAAASASAQRFDQELACCAQSGSGAAVAMGPAALGDSGWRLRSAIDSGRMKSASIARIVRMSGTVWQHRYALFVANPDGTEAQPRLYVVYLRKPLRGAYHITAVADTN